MHNVMNNQHECYNFQRKWKFSSISTSTITIINPPTYSPDIRRIKFTKLMKVSVEKYVKLTIVLQLKLFANNSCRYVSVQKVINFIEV